MRPGRLQLPRRARARSRRAHRRCGWAAALAILFQALLPAIAPLAASVSSYDAAYPSASANLVAICTGNGVIWIALDEEGRPVVPKPASAKPCHFCPCHVTVSVLPKSPPLDARGWSVAVRLTYRAEIGGRESVSLLPRPIRAPPATL